MRVWGGAARGALVILVLGLSACSSPTPPVETATEASVRLPTRQTFKALDGLAQTVKPCWNVDPRAAIEPIEVRVFVAADGRAKSAELVDPSQATKSPEMRAAATAALRAFMNPACNKLPVEVVQYRSIVILLDPAAVK